MELDLEKLSDETLLLRCKDCGEEEKRKYIAEIARRYEGPLYNYIFRMVHHRERAEDLLQEAFLNLYKNAERYREIAKVSTWLYRIAINLTLNDIRNAKVRSQVKTLWHEEGDSRSGMDNFPQEGMSPSEVLEQRDSDSEIQKKLMELPEKYRSVLILYHLQELDYQSISEVLDIKMGTVKSRLSRARNQLGDLLDEKKREDNMDNIKKSI